MSGKNQGPPLQATQAEDEVREQGFLARWSQRKLETETLAPAPSQELGPKPEAAPVEASDTPPGTHGGELTDADMPPLESLGEDSDYRAFLSPKVSESLRKAALRKLFRQSRFNAVDGLDDYAEDFTCFEPLGDLVTHEMKRMLERTRKALEQDEEVEPGATPQAASADAEEVQEQVSKAAEQKEEQRGEAVDGGEVR